MKCLPYISAQMIWKGLKRSSVYTYEIIPFKVFTKYYKESKHFYWMSCRIEHFILDIKRKGRLKELYVDLKQNHLL